MPAYVVYVRQLLDVDVEEHADSIPLVAHGRGRLAPANLASDAADTAQPRQAAPGHDPRASTRGPAPLRDEAGGANSIGERASETRSPTSGGVSLASPRGVSLALGCWDMG